MAEAPKLVKESEEDSLDVPELPGGILQRRHHPSAVCPSVVNTKLRPDSSKLFQFFFHLTVSIFSFFARPNHRRSVMGNPSLEHPD